MAKGGPCAIWAMKTGDYEAHVFEGTQAGLTAALAYCGTNGVVHVYPGNSAITIPSVGAGITVEVHEAADHTRYLDSYTEYSRAGKRRNIYNVLDYDDVATAIAAVPAGGKLYFPSSAGPYTPPSAAGWSITKAIEIFSDGPGIDEDKGFEYYDSAGALNTNSVIFDIATTGSGFTLRDTLISNVAGTPAAGGTGDAVRYSGASTISDLRFERVKFLYAGRSAIRMTGAGIVVRVTIRDCNAYGCRGDGFYISTCNVVRLDNCLAFVNQGAGIRLASCSNFTINDCACDDNGDDLLNTSYGASIMLEGCSGGGVHDNNMEDFIATTVKNGLTLNNCRSITIGGNQFDIPTPSAGSCGIRIANSSSGNTVLTNSFLYVDELVNIDSASADKGNVVFPQCSDATHADGPGKVVIPSGGKNFAFLNNLTSGVTDNKGVGLLLPSMAHTSAISTAVVQDGLVVYDSTNNQMRFRINGAWYSAVVSAT